MGELEGDLRAREHTRAKDVADDGATMDTGRRSKNNRFIVSIQSKSDGFWLWVEGSIREARMR